MSPINRRHRMGQMLSIHLRDINIAVAKAWEQQFAGLHDVEVSCGDIFEHRADAIVSPANSFGYMDGGIDLIYSRVLGRHLEGELQALLRSQHFGELPVGQAVILQTGHRAIPYLVSAPTMRVPMGISRTANVYLAFRAALIAIRKHNETSAPEIASVLVPGLGTGVGDMPPDRAARQMRAAYDAIIGGVGQKERNAGAIWGEHSDLLG
jgi:O-acetyl-ADP-ribose deacetylase (regulator of RNase III)